MVVAAPPIAARLARRLSGSLPLVALLALANVAVAGAVMAQPGASKEYQIKAAFLFNFAQFVEWPAAAFDGAEAPIRFCVMGENPFGGTLEQLVRGETINQRQLVVQSAADVQEASNCHLLFISNSEQTRMGEILTGLGPGAVLTVSEVEKFAEHGGTLNFFMENNRIRFEVNPASAKRQGLRLSAQLLKLGRIVEERPVAAMQ